MRETLEDVVQDSRVVGKPILILANKQDQDGALDECELQNRLNLSTLLGENMSTVSVVSVMTTSYSGL